jgi:hypothetical protein
MEGDTWFISKGGSARREIKGRTGKPAVTSKNTGNLLASGDEEAKKLLDKGKEIGNTPILSLPIFAFFLNGGAGPQLTARSVSESTQSATAFPIHCAGWAFDIPQREQREKIFQILPPHF